LRFAGGFREVRGVCEVRSREVSEVREVCEVRAVREMSPTPRTPRTPRTGKAGGRRGLFYVRTSTATNKDRSGPARAKASISLCAKMRAVKIVGGICEVVSGSLPLASRKGFHKLLAQCKAAKVKEVYVENSRALARDAIVNEQMYAETKEAGVEIIPADFPGLYKHEAGPLDKFLRRLVCSITELEKDRVVEQLRKGREQKAIKLGEQLSKWKRQRPRAKGPVKKPPLTRKGEVKVTGRQTLFSKLIVAPAMKRRLHQLCRAQREGHASVRQLARHLHARVPWGRRGNPKKPKNLSTAQCLRLRDAILKEWPRVRSRR
jgi:DNA invertase Pin-like site-specific DNA recombinase